MINYASGHSNSIGNPRYWPHAPNVMQSYWGVLGEKQNRRHVEIMLEDAAKPLDERKANVASHFLDSGAFTLTTKADAYAREHGCSKWEFYDTREHWDFVDAYAAFVKKYADAIDHYANVDAIGNPELTWRNQRYLEKKHGLNPVPVFHQGSDLEWFRKYVARGHELIGLGWLTYRGDSVKLYDWLDATFAEACPPPSRLPVVKLHGFGVMAHDLMLRYPWWSIDSSSWTKKGAFGHVLIPPLRAGAWEYLSDPHIVTFSEDSPDVTKGAKHYLGLSRREKAIALRWLGEIEIPLGSDSEEGVINCHAWRKIANLKYYERFRLAVPEWPWPFTPPRKRRGVLA